MSIYDVILIIGLVIVTIYVFWADKNGVDHKIV